MSERPLTSDQASLVTDHMHLVEAMVRELSRALPSVGVDDLRWYAQGGLVRAAQTFDEEAGVPFSSFARLRIRWHAIDQARKERSERTKANVVARDAGIRFAMLIGESDTTPFLSEEAARERVREHRDGFAAAVVAGLCGTPTTADSAGEDALIDEEARLRVRARVSEAVEKLNDRDRALVVSHHFAGKSLKDIARDEGTSYVTVLRRHHAALARVGARLRSLHE